MRKYSRRVAEADQFKIQEINMKQGDSEMNLQIKDDKLQGAN